MTVYLMGAGIGDLSYLTLQAQQLLTQAEVLIYDALVDERLLSLVPIDCEKIDVGKRGGKPSTPQTEINALLVQYGQEKNCVIRLKAGDPFIFGRSNEEIQALTEAGCTFQVIPGLSSALTAPELAGIPLTDKHLSRCLAILTGHAPDLLDWSALAKLDTLVILMGGRNLSLIVQELIQNGKPATTPIAIIRNAGRPSCQVWTGTLKNIVAQTTGVSLSPTVMVVGEVVNLRSVGESMNLPLQGKTVLVTRSTEQSETFTDLLQQQGATVMEMPALEIRPPSSWEALDGAISHLTNFHWIVLTSSNAVHYFLNRLSSLGLDSRALAGVKIAVVGKKTAATLKKYHLQPNFIPPDFIADSLVEHFPESLQNLHILFPRVETGGREVLVKELTAKGAKVVEVPAYESGCPDSISPSVWEALQNHSVDVVTFASSKTVHNFYSLIKNKLTSSLDKSAINEQERQISIQEMLTNICIASIGPQTSSACRQRLGRVNIEATEYTLEGLTQAIVNFVTKQS